jgi:hypothetical protein
MKYKYSFFCFLITCWIVQVHAREPRNLLQGHASFQEVKTALADKTEWIKYPAYRDRAGWDALTGSLKQKLIADGEKYLSYEWQAVKASDYLEYERSGSRVAMENPFGANNIALSRLVFAELAEGKGRFMDQIINGVWHDCEMSSWALSAHLTAQKSKRSLPDFTEQIIDLTSGDRGSFLSWTWYFFHKEWDRVNPVISAKVRKNIQERILDPYMARSDYWWQAFNAKPGTLVNNWNVWCNANVLACFLLVEDDKDKLAAAVHRTMASVDQFINYVKEDGACEEGPSYWGHAAGKLYDYLQLLSNATNGKISIFDNPMIRNMGEYISRSYVGNGWVVNFADASAKGGGEPGLIYRYGKATGSREMQQFAAYLIKQRGKYEISADRDFFRSVENIASFGALLAEQPALTTAAYTWYPQTQVCYIKNQQGFFFAAKGGHNNESHNHNDVGTFSLYIDTIPFFIDAGVGTYTRQTFSNERYSIWTMQSNYHNLSLINGMPQPFGAQYKAKDVQFDAKKKIFSLDISGAYPKDAAVKAWKRSYTLSDKEGLIILDEFQLSEAKDYNQLNFLTWTKPDIGEQGRVVLEKDGKRVQMKYDAALFSASIEAIPQTDTRLSNVWGKEIYRLQLKAKQKNLKGKYLFTINKL